MTLATTDDPIAYLREVERQIRVGLSRNLCRRCHKAGATKVALYCHELLKSQTHGMVYAYPYHVTCAPFARTYHGSMVYTEHELTAIGRS